MPDVSINDLPVASSLQDSGLLVVYQNNQTQSVTGQKVKSYAAEAATEIAEPVAAAAVDDKFDDMAVSATTLSPGSQATATYNPDTNTLALGIPRGADGQGAGDMTKAVYDPTNAVYNAGGIPNFVGNKISDPAQKSAGQVLTYNGTSWVADDPSSGAFVVHITDSGGTYSADKTFAEISAAYSSDSVVYATYDSNVYQLEFVISNKCAFIAPDGYGFVIMSSNVISAFQTNILNRETGISSADTNYSTVMARGIYAGTSGMTSGTTSLTSGVIYLQYE